jgi:hypothetical protein
LSGFTPTKAPDPPRTASDRLAYRQFKITTKRPEPPRELGFLGNLLTWKPPQRDENVTHYRIRIDTDAGDPDYEVSAGQKSQLLYQGSMFYVSSYNAPMRLESKRAMITGSPGIVAPRICASFNLPGEVVSTDAATNPIELSLPEGYSFRCVSGWANCDESTPGTGDMICDLLYSEDSGATWTSILAAGGAIGAVRVVPGGSGYAAGDELTVVQAGGSGATLRVDTTLTTDVLTYTLIDGGTGYTTATGVATTTDGSGTGATFDIDVGQMILHAGEVQLPVEYKVFTGYPTEYLDLPRRSLLKLGITGTGLPSDALVQLVGELVKDRVERGGRSTDAPGGIRIEQPIPWTYVGTGSGH